LTTPAAKGGRAQEAELQGVPAVACIYLLHGAPYLIQSSFSSDSGLATPRVGQCRREQSPSWSTWLSEGREEWRPAAPACCHGHGPRHHRASTSLASLLRRTSNTDQFAPIRGAIRASGSKHGLTPSPPGRWQPNLPPSPERMAWICEGERVRRPA
jgi:hypothetical protein